MHRVLSYAALLCASLACAPNAAEDIPPIKNVVVILADDHARHVTGSYGNDLIRTPHIDRLAATGVTFDRAYCNAPICSASRASLLTGKYPHATGVNLLFTPFPDAGNRTLAEILRDYDYQTALFGKTHFNNWLWAPLYADGLPDHGFDTLVDAGRYRQWRATQTEPTLPENLAYYDRETVRDSSVAAWMNAGARPHPVYERYSEGTFYTDRAIEFMQAAGERPFLVWLAYKEPHHPFYFPVEYAGRYDPDSLPLPAGSPEDERWIPEKYRSLTDAQKRGIIAAYYTATEYLDHNIGRVLTALDELQLADETLVLYLSDNGYLLNDHRRFEKHTLWEEAVRQPLIVRPGSSFRPGRRADALVEYVDVVPTILDLLGLAPAAGVQGRSFRSVLAGTQPQHRTAAFAEYLEDNTAMIRTADWKYIFATGRRDLGIGYHTGAGPSGMVHRLYNLREDPGETRNVADLPENQPVLREMQERMLARFRATHPDSERCPEDLTPVGQLVWFCEPRDVGADQSLEDIPWRVFERE